MTARPLRVAYVYSQPFEVTESGVVFSANASYGFAEAGAHALLIAADAGRSVSEVAAKIGLEPHPRWDVRLLRALRVRGGPIRPSWLGPFRSAAVEAAREFKADVVVCRDLKTARAFVAARFEGRVLYEVHDIFGVGEAPVFGGEPLPRHRARRIPIENEILSSVDGVITLTRALAEILVRTRPVSQRVVSAPSACRPLAEPAGTADRRHIAYVGSLAPEKGAGHLVRVLDRLPERARLLIFGRGRNIDVIKDIARTVGVEGRIDYTGFVAPAQLPHHLARCRVGAVPLTDVFFNRAVTSPMKVFDYIASGVVPVVPDFPVFREIFEDDSPAVFFDPGRDDALIAAIGGLFTDDAAFRRRHLAALHQATQWTWSSRAARILSFAADLPYRAERKPRPRPGI